MTAIRELIEAVEAGWFPADMSGDQLHPGLATLTPYEAFNGSVDAALALMAAVLPGWGWVVQDCGTPYAIAVRGNVSYVESADTPARALLLAILKAMEARG